MVIIRCWFVLQLTSSNFVKTQTKKDASNAVLKCQQFRIEYTMYAHPFLKCFRRYTATIVTEERALKPFLMSNRKCWLLHKICLLSTTLLFWALKWWAARQRRLRTSRCLVRSPCKEKVDDWAGCSLQRARRESDSTFDNCRHKSSPIYTHWIKLIRQHSKHLTGNGSH